jgi:hypothetical protein
VQRQHALVCLGQKPASRLALVGVVLRQGFDEQIQVGLLGSVSFVVNAPTLSRRGVKTLDLVVPGNLR